jgi:hypothetical protein
VTYIRINLACLDASVAQVMQQFFPGLMIFSYSLKLKTRLVSIDLDVYKGG